MKNKIKEYKSGLRLMLFGRWLHVLVMEVFNIKQFSRTNIKIRTKIGTDLNEKNLNGELHTCTSCNNFPDRVTQYNKIIKLHATPRHNNNNTYY